MADQIPSKFPSELGNARRVAGQSQKALALASGLNQSVLCAIEKGRRRGPGRDTVDRLAGALGLGEGPAEALHWAATHDRVLELVFTERASALPIVSLALQLENALSPEELSGCEAFLKELLGSKTVLAQIAARRRPAKEAAMD